MQAADRPLTAAARGVFLVLACAVAAIAALSAAGILRPAFPNEAPAFAVTFLLGAIVAAAAAIREPWRAATVWLGANLAGAAVVLAFPVPLGLALP